MDDSGVEDFVESPQSYFSELPSPPLLMVVSAPSGSGKSTICHQLVNPPSSGGDGGSEIVFSVSTTTREPRGQERDGVDYHFVDDETFDQMIAQNEFIEWAEVHGERYGTSRRTVLEALESDCDVVLEIDVQGARQVKESCPSAVLVFIAPPSIEELERRLHKRGTESPQQIQRRLQNARHEFESIPEYDYLVINDEVDRAVEQIRSIQRAEKCRLSRLVSGGPIPDLRKK